MHVEFIYAAQKMAVSARPRTSSSGYEKLRVSHKRAYAYLSKALEIDERGVGKRARLLASVRKSAVSTLARYMLHALYVRGASYGGVTGYPSHEHRHRYVTEQGTAQQQDRDCVYVSLNWYPLVFCMT